MSNPHAGITAITADGIIRTSGTYIRFTDEQRARMALTRIDRLVERDREITVRFTAAQLDRITARRAELAEPAEPAAPQVAVPPPRRTGEIRIKMTAEQAYRARIANARARSSWWH